MAENDELEAIRRRKMQMLMERARQPPKPQVEEPLANGQVNVLTDATFWPTIQKTRIALVDFFGEWCGPCNALAPTMAELARKYEGKVFFGKIDIDRNPRTTAQFRVQSVPIVHVFQNGRPTRSVLGLRPFSDYEALVQLLLREREQQA
ncbi:MAG: thioredoxin family protein [Candidatus Thorarchaeota archaeon]